MRTIGKEAPARAGGLRGDRLLLLAAFAAAAALVWHGAREAYWSDFGVEAYPAYKALQAGDLHTFLERVPVYAGYVTVVAGPLALLAGWLGGIEELAFGLTAIPAGVAIALLTAGLARRLREQGARPLAVFLALAAPLPLVKLAFDYGHPEDVLAATASVAAVLAALRGRTTAATVLLALAIVSKQWAVLAVLPTMLAAPRHSVRLGLIALGAGGAVLAPLALLAPDGQHPLLSTASLFHSQQLWWPFGVVIPAGADVPNDATAVAPAWLSLIAHPLVALLPVPLAALWWRRRRGRREDVLALLALLFLARCALDPWNIHYYHLPLVLAVLGWEVARGRELPVLTLATVGAVWLSFYLPGSHYGTGLFVLYMAWALPLAGYLGWTLYGAPLPSERPWLAEPISAARPSSRSISTT